MENSGASTKSVVSDMDDQSEMRNEARKWAARAIDTYADEKSISKEIKAKFDEKYGPTWHCIVGTDFKAFFTHERKTFIYFNHGKVAICLYKAG